MANSRIQSIAFFSFLAACGSIPADSESTPDSGSVDVGVFADTSSRDAGSSSDVRTEVETSDPPDTFGEDVADATPGDADTMSDISGEDADAWADTSVDAAPDTPEEDSGVVEPTHCEVVHFIDPDLKDALSHLDTDGDGLIEGSEVESVTTVTVSYHFPVETLGGLECFHSLEDLDISDNAIGDISALADLRHLRRLDMFGNDPGSGCLDWGPLSAVTTLEEIELAYSRVCSINPIGGLVNLRLLWTGTIVDGDIGALRNMSRLENLAFLSYEWTDLMVFAVGSFPNLTRLSFNLPSGGENLWTIRELRSLENLSIHDIGDELTSLDIFMPLPALTDLDVNNNGEMSDISAISGSPLLERVSIAGNSIVDLRPLLELGVLRVLAVNRNLVRDITPLAAIESLEIVHLGNNSLTCQQINEAIEAGVPVSLRDYESYCS